MKFSGKATAPAEGRSWDNGLLTKLSHFPLSMVAVAIACQTPVAGSVFSVKNNFPLSLNPSNLTVLFRYWPSSFSILASKQTFSFPINGFYNELLFPQKLYFCSLAYTNVAGFSPVFQHFHKSCRFTLAFKRDSIRFLAPVTDIFRLLYITDNDALVAAPFWTMVAFIPDAVFFLILSTSTMATVEFLSYPTA